MTHLFDRVCLVLPSVGGVCLYKTTALLFSLSPFPRTGVFCVSLDIFQAIICRQTPLLVNFFVESKCHILANITKALFPFEVTVALLPGSEIMSLSRMTLERALFFFSSFFFKSRACGGRSVGAKQQQQQQAVVFSTACALKLHVVALLDKLHSIRHRE